jgi:hypothetical protein
MLTLEQLKKISMTTHPGRIPQLGERWHRSGNARRFWSPAPGAPKAEASRG